MHIATIQRRPPALIDLRTRLPIDKLLEWTYREQRADIVVGMGAGLHRAEAQVDGVELAAISTCGCVAVARIAELGCRVNGNGGPPGHLHVDAERVHEHVQKMGRHLAHLLISTARAGGPPDWGQHAIIRANPLRNGRGQVRLYYDDWDKGRNYGWCPLEWTGSVARIDAAREEYTAWWNALKKLRHELRGRVLADHIAEAPRAVAAPWGLRKFHA